MSIEQCARQSKGQIYFVASIKACVLRTHYPTKLPHTRSYREGEKTCVVSESVGLVGPEC